jgi:sugar lactone lactonase YvrE
MNALSRLKILFILPAALLLVINKADAYLVDLENPPGLLAVDDKDNFYVTTGYWQWVEKISPNGSDIGQFGKNLDASYMVFTKDGDYYVLTRDYIAKFAKSGEKLCEFGAVPQLQPYTKLELRGPVTTTPARVEPRHPYALALDSKGNVYVSDTRTNTIDRFTASGKYLGVFATLRDDRNKGMAFDAAGNLYVVNGKSKTIEKISPDGADMGVFVDSGLVRPEDIVIDRTGNLYVMDSGDKGIRVKKFSPAGKELGVVASDRTFNCRGMALDHEGNLYIVSFWDGEVLKYSPDGKNLGAFITDGARSHVW